MSRIFGRAPEPARCVDPACRYSDGRRWTVCPRCGTSISDTRFTFPDMHSTYVRLREDEPEENPVPPAERDA